MERQPYDTDLSDAEWDRIRPLLPASCPRGRPIEVPRREIVNAILYVLRAGCAWRRLPHDLPRWTLVYWYFQVWRSGVPMVCGCASAPRCAGSCAGPRAGRPRPVPPSSTASR